jgi:uncharacterized YigZ family protein
MKFLKEKTIHQIEINKSIFIAILYPLSSLEDIAFLLKQTKIDYPKANHYCNASFYGDNKEHATASDDGEPQRTAGIPILEVLKHHDVTNILCVVVRYFGGVKLGSGGLVRAYTKACADVMSTAKFFTKKIVPSYEIVFTYSMIDKVDHYLEQKATVLEKNFLQNVTYRIYLNDSDSSVLDDLSHQLISIKELDAQILYINT